MTTKVEDLAVRVLVETLHTSSDGERERIIPMGPGKGGYGRTLNQWHDDPVRLGRRRTSGRACSSRERGQEHLNLHSPKKIRRAMCTLLPPRRTTTDSWLPSQSEKMQSRKKTF
jgi:hypothetical protein